MNLATPITTTSEITSISELVLSDNKDRKYVTATFRTNLGQHPRPVLLWKGDAYDAAGDWKQDEAEARLIELLSATP